MTPVPEREVLASAAALLDQGERIDWLSRASLVTALTALAAFGILGVNKPAAAALLATSVLTGIAELYLAVRVGFDAALFRRLADTPAAVDFAKLDGALTTLGILAPGKTARTLAQRTSGALRLFRCQASLAAAQTLLFLAGAVMAILH
jgi:hypothetical protein